MLLPKACDFWEMNKAASGLTPRFLGKQYYTISGAELRIENTSSFRSTWKNIDISFSLALIIQLLYLLLTVQLLYLLLETLIPSRNPPCQTMSMTEADLRARERERSRSAGRPWMPATTTATTKRRRREEFWLSRVLLGHCCSLAS